MDGLTKLLVLLGLKERPPWVDERGVVQWGRMDADFRSKCVVWADGRTIIAEGYTSDAHVREVLRDLRDTGAVPGGLREKRGSVEDVAAAWRGGEASRGSRMADQRLVEKLFAILEEAVEAEADDVFFESGESNCRVLVSVNNSKLPLGTPLTKTEGDWMIHHLFYCKTEGSKLVSFIKSEQQGWGLGRDEMRLPEKIAALRYESGPNVVSDHLVVRIFPKNRITEDMTLEKLGHRGEIVEILREIRMSKYGAVIIAGPTGEGKSTTNTVNMMTQMKEHDYRLNMVTVDDPVENRIRGAIQIQVPSGGVGDDRLAVFEKVLMHFVRIHPQVGGIGEIRDLETAKQVLQFVDSGHQIYTTLHSHNANGIPFRLLDMGVETAQLVKPGNIRLFMNQRLMSIVCPDCCKGEPAGDRRLPAELEAMLGGEVRYRNPKGCETCLKKRRTELARTAWAGYLNRLAFAEWIRPDDGYLKFVSARDALGAWDYWLREMGGVTLGAKIWRAVDDGLVDPFDALAKGAQIAEAQDVFRPGPPKLSVVEDGPELVS